MRKEYFLKKTFSSFQKASLTKLGGNTPVVAGRLVFNISKNFLCLDNFLLVLATVSDFSFNWI